MNQSGCVGAHEYVTKEKGEVCGRHLKFSKKYNIQVTRILKRGVK